MSAAPTGRANATAVTAASEPAKPRRSMLSMFVSSCHGGQNPAFLSEGSPSSGVCQTWPAFRDQAIASCLRWPISSPCVQPNAPDRETIQHWPYSQSRQTARAAGGWRKRHARLPSIFFAGEPSTPTFLANMPVTTTPGDIEFHPYPPLAKFLETERLNTSTATFFSKPTIETTSVGGGEH
jgi:hypothetical protein